MKILALILILAGLTSSYAKGQTDRPIIGMLAMKITDKVILEEKPELEGKSYIGASYVKFVQSAGGRVVPIVDDPRSIKTLDSILQHVNGVMLPGGEINLIDSKYYKIAKKIFETAIAMNKKGIYFPMFGVCRGFQAMPVLTEGSIKILELTDSKNVSLPMKIPDDYKSTKMFKDLSDDLKNILETKDITANYHKYGIDPNEMKNNKKLSDEYRILGTSIDVKGKPFVAAYEGKCLIMISSD